LYLLVYYDTGIIKNTPKLDVNVFDVATVMAFMLSAFGTVCEPMLPRWRAISGANGSPARRQPGLAPLSPFAY
jgi:hypothetical protein